MTEQVKSVIRNTVLEMLAQSTSDENIRNTYASLLLPNLLYG